jgi:hypothetical protein
MEGSVTVAVVYPRTLEHLEVSSRAERKLHKRFTELDEPYTVFFSPSWIVGGRNAKQPITGETDFVVAHPDRGALVLEVKGGSVSFDPTTASWRSTGRAGSHQITDPFKQARKSRFALREIIDRVGASLPNALVGEAVAFPDVILTKADVPGVYPADVVLDRSRVDDLEGSLAAVFDFWQLNDNDSSFGSAGVDRLIRALAQPTEIRAPLGLELADADKQLIELTKNQHEILTALSANHRVCVRGAAGTGKTALAAEQARRLVAQGHEVLLTCFNRSLGEFLRESLNDEPRITVMHFHGLCREWAERAGLDTKRAPGERSEDHYNERLPSLLMDAASALDQRFGAIIIDEAQDFDSGWITALELLLDDLERGVFYLFGDDNQAIYGRSMSVPTNFFNYRLTENCRNTRTIHRALDTCFPGQAARALGPPGVEIEIEGWSGEQGLAKALSTTLHRWIVDERVPPSDVVVLTGRRPERSQVAKAATRISRFRLCARPRANNDIRLASVHAYKGLESPLVILCELEAAWPQARRELWYTALSRARVHVVVLAEDVDADSVDDIEDLLSSSGVLSNIVDQQRTEDLVA